MRMSALAIFISFSFSASANDADVSALLSGVDAATQPIIEFKDTLYSSNAEAQLVIFQRAKAIKSKRPDLFEIALHTALSSDSAALRSLALWEILSDRAAISIKISDPNSGKPYNESRYLQLGGAIGFAFADSDVHSKTINLAKPPNRNSIEKSANRLSVSGETVTVVYDFGNDKSGNGSMLLSKDGRSLEGRFSHKMRGATINVKGQMNLY